MVAFDMGISPQIRGALMKVQLTVTLILFQR
jgi:hypothetical protein